MKANGRRKSRRPRTRVTTYPYTPSPRPPRLSPLLRVESNLSRRGIFSRAPGVRFAVEEVRFLSVGSNHARDFPPGAPRELRLRRVVRGDPPPHFLERARVRARNRGDRRRHVEGRSPFFRGRVVERRDGVCFDWVVRREASRWKL